MAVSVVEIHESAGVAALGTTYTRTITTTPQAGDVVVIAVSVYLSYAVNSISGLGATWTQAHAPNDVPSNFRQSIWVGTGATSSGTVTITANANRQGIVTAFLVRGLLDATVADSAGTSVAASPSITGPSFTAGNGQFVVDLLAAGTESGTTTFPNSPSPASGWVTQTLLGSTQRHGTTYRLPTAGGAHQVGATFGAAPDARLTQVVLGSAVTTSPVALTGVTANLAVGAPAGTVQTVTPAPVALTGVTANIAAAAISGVLAAGLALTGATAGVTVAAPAGTVVAADGTTPVNLTGVTAGVVISAPAGTVAAAGAVALTGAPAAVAITAHAGTVVTSDGQTLAGGFAFGSTLTTTTAALQTGMSGGFAFGSRLKQSRTWTTDPRSNRPSPHVVITQRDGTPVVPLRDVSIAPLDFRGVGIPDSWRFSIDRDDEAARIIDPATHFAQLYRGDVLMSKGPIGPERLEGGRYVYDVSDPTWDMRDRRRTIGRVPKLNWIVNGDFSRGLAGWRGSYDPGSAPEAAPVMEVVDEVESSSGKALRIEGVDKVVTNVANVETAAVFVANEATYLSGGAALVIAAAADIPDGATIHVVGHTADRRAYGDPGTGLALSLARAQAAKSTLAAHNATWTFTLLPGLRTPNMNDGVVAGRGYYEQVAPNSNETDSAKNRRVALHYTSTQTATGHRQYALQTRYGVTNPVENLVEMPVTLTGRMIIEEWIGAPLDEWAMRLSLASMDGTVIDEATVTMTEKTPRQRIFDYDATVNVPADGESYWLGIRLYPPAGSSLWFDVNLYPHEQLGFFGVDQAHIIRDLVQHVQDPAMGKGDLGIGTRTTPTGIRRTMEFPFHERWPWDSAVEKITSLNRGVEVDCEMTPTSTTIVTHYPRQGSVASLPLAHGGQKSIVKAYRPIPSAGLASSVIVQGWGFGAARAERYARDESAFGGALLEAVIEAEEGTPPGELDEVAVQKLARSIHPRAAWEVVLDPARTSEILDDIGKGDSSLLSLPDEAVHSLHRLVAWTWDPETDGLAVQCAPEEG